MKCKECGEAMTTHPGYGQTLVAYSSPPGHDHDDNCKSKTYTCKNGHTVRISKRNRCPECDWVGKSTCFCHKGEKVDEWPEAEEIMPEWAKRKGE